MRRRLLGVAVAVLIGNGFAGLSHAADWVAVYKGSDSIVSVDRSTVAVEGQVINLWIGTELTQPDQENGVNFDQQMSRTKINCASWQWTSTTKIQWLQRQPVNEWQGNQPYQDILIDTPFDAIAKKLCGKT
jgi:hypothetical protein